MRDHLGRSMDLNFFRINVDVFDFLVAQNRHVQFGLAVHHVVNLIRGPNLFSVDAQDDITGDETCRWEPGDDSDD